MNIIKISKWLKKGGVAFIGNIPESEKIWDFYNSTEREGVFFKEILEEKPIIGTWYSRAFLEKLALYCNFSKATSFDQPKDFLSAHYRFDILLNK
jgi:hypothetical protein